MRCAKVLTIQVPRSPARIPAFLSHCWALDPPLQALPPIVLDPIVLHAGLTWYVCQGKQASTKEDAKRTKLYKEGVARHSTRRA